MRRGARPKRVGRLACDSHRSRLPAPAEHGVTGMKSFLVSHDGVVYEKDLGQESLSEFEKMQRLNPDQSWQPVQETERM